MEQRSDRTGNRGASKRIMRAAVRLRQFRRAEDGSILIFGIIMLTCIILLSGLALDVIHFEAERTTATATLDRAVLAAADLSNDTAPQDVVDDYFDKAGVSRFSPVASATYGSLKEWKKVAGTVQVATDTWFMRTFGIDQLAAPSAATAEEAIGNVEISMVLDVSGSMALDSQKVWDSTTWSWVYKLTLLKPAAVNFVKTMFKNVSGAGTAGGNLMISVVPYAEQVNLGTALSAKMTLTSEHSQGTCVDFVSSDFNSIAVTPTQTLPRTAFADVRSSEYHSSSTVAPYFRECWGYDTTQTTPVLAFSQNQQTIIDKINALTAEGDTAIDIGAKWGLALLDPAIRPALNNMVTAGTVDSSLKNHPTDYKSNDTLKIMVLMTDGDNTNTFRLKNYRSGNATIGNNVSIVYNNSGTRKYYWYDSSRSTKKYFDISAQSWTNVTGSTTTMTWQEVWQVYNVDYFSRKAYASATGGSSTTFFNNAVDHTANDAKDAQLNSVCSLAKDKGTKIFAIAFGASDRGKAALKKCVSADSYYYESSGADISDAFAGIANSIRMLRLTQ